MRHDEIWLAEFPFGDVPGMKLRPVLLLTEPIGKYSEVIAAYISSVIPSDLLATDLVVDPASPNAARTGLKSKSVVRLHKVATIVGANARRKLGFITSDVSQAIDEKLRKMLSL